MSKGVLVDTTLRWLYRKGKGGVPLPKGDLKMERGDFFRIFPI